MARKSTDGEPFDSTGAIVRAWETNDRLTQAERDRRPSRGARGVVRGPAWQRETGPSRFGPTSQPGQR